MHFTLVPKTSLIVAPATDGTASKPITTAVSKNNLRSVDMPAGVDGVDLAVIVTAHPTVDHREITER